MASYIVVGATCLLVGFVAGLLVGRKNPSVADAAQEAVNQFNQNGPNKPNTP